MYYSSLAENLNWSFITCYEGHDCNPGCD